MTRLQTLFARRERLIEANIKHGFIRSQPYRYISILKEIRIEIKKEELRIMKENINSSFSEFLQATKGLSGEQILILSNNNEARKTQSQRKCI